jgi:enoyl-CoA hydratase/carnithine racemase
MSYEALEVTRDGAVTWLTLNRPPQLDRAAGKLAEKMTETRRSAFA